jgi:hypothetical protein
MTQPAPSAYIACAAQLASAVAQQFMGTHPRSEAEYDPLSKSDSIALDPTQ